MKTIAASEVAVAEASSEPSQKTSRGTITLPPPTPNRPLKGPAAVPIAISLSGRLSDLSDGVSAATLTRERVGHHARHTRPRVPRCHARGGARAAPHRPNP